MEEKFKIYDVEGLLLIWGIENGQCVAIKRLR